MLSVTAQNKQEEEELKFTRAGKKKCSELHLQQVVFYLFGFGFYL